MYTGKNSIRVALWVLGNKTKKVKGKSLHKKSQPSILWVPLKGAHTYITDGPKNGGENFILKGSKSQKHVFLKLHCPKNEQNIRQNFALASCSIGLVISEDTK